MKKHFLIAIAFGHCLLTACASSPPYRAGDPVVLVQPNKEVWRKSGATMADVTTAKLACRDEVRSDSNYMAAVHEAAEIGNIRRSERTSDDKRRQRAADNASDDIFVACMNGKGFQYMKGGFEICPTCPQP